MSDERSGEGRVESDGGQLAVQGGGCAGVATWMQPSARSCVRSRRIARHRHSLTHSREPTSRARHLDGARMMSDAMTRGDAGHADH